MAFGDYRRRVRRIAFFTIFGWVALTTIIVLLMIWDEIDDNLLSKLVWSATTVTIGVLAACITYLGFASAEEGATSAEDVEGRDEKHLREAFDKAKIPEK